MYILSTKSDFDSAHFLKDYDGKCANIHGHRWTVSIDVEGSKLEESGPYRGMVVDFSELKKSLRKLTKALDHAFIMEEGSLKASTRAALEEEGFKLITFPFRPTAENFAKYFYDKMSEAGYKVAKVSVYETPNNIASYVPDKN
ncbi:MAG: 6-carboxytetrahydropterin synthase QueD [Eubacterium sp.]|nr:6-carboxytetrahydropterin synthase QueD [Eubacterium sp.]